MGCPTPCPATVSHEPLKKSLRWPHCLTRSSNARASPLSAALGTNDAPIRNNCGMEPPTVAAISLVSRSVHPGQLSSTVARVPLFEGGQQLRIPVLHTFVLWRIYPHPYRYRRIGARPWGGLVAHAAGCPKRPGRGQRSTHEYPPCWSNSSGVYGIQQCISFSAGR